MRRTIPLLSTMTIAVLLVSVAALLWTQQAKAQEPCNFSFCLDKTADRSTVTVGEPITFTITERCIHIECTVFPPLVDQLPSGLAVDRVDDSQADIQCTTSVNTVTCPGRRISTPTQPFTLTIVATTTECGEFTNTASNSVDPDGAEAAFTVVRCPPPTKEQCKNGGWSDPAFAFPNQGTCESAVNRQNRQ
jgi:hypothetical protein